MFWLVGKAQIALEVGQKTGYNPAALLVNINLTALRNLQPSAQRCHVIRGRHGIVMREVPWKVEYLRIIEQLQLRLHFERKLRNAELLTRFGGRQKELDRRRSTDLGRFDDGGRRAVACD